MRQTSSATSVVTDDHGALPWTSRRRRCENGSSVAQASRNTSVIATSRMVSAISLGVFCRLAPSTSAIMRSRKDSPCRAVMRTTSQSDSTTRAAGDRGEVAARFADHRRGFAGDRRSRSPRRRPR